MSRKCGTLGGGGWVHSGGENSMALSVIVCTSTYLFSVLPPRCYGIKHFSLFNCLHEWADVACLMV